MALKILTSVYLLIGIACSIAGPLSKNNKVEIISTTYDNKRYFALRKASFIFTLILISILLYPIFFFEYYYKTPYRAKRKIATPKFPGKLYYSDTCGFGTLICNNCFKYHEFICFMHGFGENSWSTTGYQCQSCGDLYNHKRQQKNPIQVPPCSCGGKLSKEDVIVCPHCKSDEVLYCLEYLT